MAFEDVILGLELGILSVLPVVLAILAWLFYRFSKRHHIWADIQLPERAVRPKVLPKDGMLMTRWGAWKIVNGTATMFKNRPMYRCAFNYPYTLAYDRQRLLVEIETEKKDKDGKVTKQKAQEWQDVVNPAFPIAPDNNRIATHLKTHLFNEIYQSKAGITLLLLVVAFLVVVSILIQVVK